MDLSFRAAEQLGEEFAQVGRVAGVGVSGGGGSEWHQPGTIRDDIGGVKKQRLSLRTLSPSSQPLLRINPSNHTRITTAAPEVRLTPLLRRLGGKRKNLPAFSRHLL